MKTTFNAPVEDCLENFLDCPHAATVHRLWFRTSAAKPVEAIVRTLPDGAVAEYIDEPREKSAVFGLLSQKSAKMTHTDRFIAPATSEVDYQFSNGDRCMITSTCRPIHDRLTMVYTVMSFRFRLWGPLVRLVFHPMSRIIITQDVRMLDRQQNNLRRFNRPHRYNVIRQDLLATHIWQWRNALNADTPLPEAGHETRVEMQF
jgi:phenylpropionate dioxygenase-like ring-hydroxylating dioxygenase large terminal subunit